jgi:plastocyanin
MNFAFSPTPLNISAGTKVTVTNQDSTTHTWTSDDGKFNSGNLAAAAASNDPNNYGPSSGESFSFTFSAPGKYTYHCSIHSSMKGEVDVT